MRVFVGPFLGLGSHSSINTKVTIHTVSSEQVVSGQKFSGGL